MEVPDDPEDPERSDLPIIPEKQSTLGMRMTENLPEIVTKEGVHMIQELH